MDNLINGVIGISGCLLSSATAQNEVTTWVSIICSCAIALVTCGLQIYRMIRDRDKTSTEEDKESEEDNNAND